ncbi:hypothetical protein V7088_19795 [Priestia megaterium]|uniref:hypothetical protein n=1 Tax=Priestia megaterium TaxID=1404 RepID=UPI000BF2C5FD|nr:hypothetical protein [Priestia megaterium]PFP32630.1 hypothetical protein COK03_27410 [Priestia megaterium]
MKIREIIELSKTNSLAKIAKEHLSVGKEKAREGLKLAGCYSKNGVKGWFFDGDESVLEQSIYDFVSSTRKAKSEVDNANKEASATIEKPRLINNPTSQQYNKTDSKQVGKSTIQETTKPIMKKVTYEIEEYLHDELKIKAIKEKRTVSEIVNDIIKQGLK